MSAPKQQEGKDPNDVIMRHVEPDDNRLANYTQVQDYRDWIHRT